MTDQSNDKQLSMCLKACSDPTRRSILTTLVQEGPTRVTDLAVHYEMSLNAVKLVKNRSSSNSDEDDYETRKVSD